MYDTAGQDDFAEMRYSPYFKCDCFILVFSIFIPSYVDDMYPIYKDIEDVFADINKVPIVIAANHCDLRDEQDKIDLVPIEQYKIIEERFKSPVIEVSAKTNIVINQLFEKVIRKYLEINKINPSNTFNDSQKHLKKKSFWSKHFGK